MTICKPVCFLRSQQVCSYSRNSQHFMEPEGSLPHSQVPATCPYPEPARSIPKYHSRPQAHGMNASQQVTFLRRGVVSTSPNPQIRGPPLVCCPRLLIQYIRSYPPYWRPFFHPQSEDAPCRGDRDPLNQ